MELLKLIYKLDNEYKNADVVQFFHSEIKSFDMKKWHLLDPKHGQILKGDFKYNILKNQFKTTKILKVEILNGS